MVDFLLVRVRLVVCLADTFRDYLGIALLVAGIFAIGTLHASSILEKIPAKSASHNVVELLRNKLVALFFVYLFLPLADCTLTVKTEVKRSPVFQLFRWRNVSFIPISQQGEENSN